MNTHLPNSLREVQTRSQQIERQIDTIVRGNPDFSLVDLIASKVPDAPRRFTTPEETQRALQYASDLHNACRASEPPNSIGHLVPLAAMARALTTGTSASFISGNKSTEVPAGFAQRSALLGGGATVLGQPGDIAQADGAFPGRGQRQDMIAQKRDRRVAAGGQA